MAKMEEELYYYRCLAASYPNMPLLETSPHNMPAQETYFQDGNDDDNIPIDQAFTMLDGGMPQMYETRELYHANNLTAM